MAYLTSIIIKLLPCIGTTLLISVSAMLLGLVFGTLICAMKLSHSKVLRSIASAYITMVRSTPTMILLFLVYYGVPVILSLFGIFVGSTGKIGFAIVALTLYSSMTLAEIIRPAYLSIDPGQMEAALMCGLTRRQAFTRIIAPQTVFIAFPNFGNMIIALIQESSLAYLIGVLDVMGKAKMLSNMDFGVHIVEIYVAVSILYWILSLVIGKSVDVITYRMDRILR